MTTADDALTRTVTDIAPLIERGEIGVVDLVDAQLGRIAALDGQLHGWLLVTADLARAQARRADAEIAAGRYRGPLHGIPIGVTDLIDVAGIPTTCASPLLRGQRAMQDAAVVDKLRAAGAVIVGKLNVAEFALYGHHPAFTPPSNPWPGEHRADAASGGAGVAVAAALCFGAIGTDTGGSIRWSAAACGVTGLKPGFGKISRRGVFPLADTLDHVGALTRSVADTALLLAVLEGPDERDPISRCDPDVDYVAALASGAQGLRVGIDRRYCSADTDPAQYDACARACFMLKAQGLQIVDIELDGLAEAGKDWLTLCAVDALLHHRRWYPAQADDYGPAFRALLERAVQISAADYARAQHARQRVTALFERALHQVDAVLCPVLPQATASPSAWQSLLRYTAPSSLSGHPALALPNGFDAAGLPTGMQCIGRLGDEATLLRIGAAYQRATEWHRRRPPLP